uniref:NADH-ubiquinone oxidoreductase chain 6 n=1 Tax=Chorisquilla orientalis TaxID=2766993 RepID=A0A7H0TV12_9CRUS|nr:NADH dehydrogenase subunit 6 [Chorisquilla orientalis]
MSYILLLYLTSMTLSLVFINITHPLAMGMMLLLQTLAICAITALMNFHAWFSYILFLTFLGGMLVLFIYITSLTSNEMFQFSFKMITFFALTISLGMLTTMIMYSSLIISFQNSFFSLSFIHYAVSRMASWLGMGEEKPVLISNIYSTNTMNTTLSTGMILYLLSTLIVVVKITYTFLGPLLLLTT